MHTNASTNEREWVDARSGRPHLIAALRNDKNRLVMLRTNFRRWSEENIVFPATALSIESNNPISFIAVLVYWFVGLGVKIALQKNCLRTVAVTVPWLRLCLPL
jgi:hypothetical protein